MRYFYRSPEDPIQFMIDELETLQEANRRRLGVILRATGQTPADELQGPGEH